MILAWFLIASFAVYKIARGMASEEGPFSLFLKWRDWLGEATWVGRGFHCMSCISFWAGLAAALLIGASSWRELLLLWGGIAGLATALWRLFG
jgi:hypothetical protein